MASVGIDLGTTNSVASHVVGGKPVVIPNRDGEDLTPSVVSFRPDSRGGEYLVGVQAARFASQAPQDTIFSIKRLMGLNFDDLNVQAVRKNVPYTICRSDMPEKDASAQVLIAGKQHTPIDISRMILERIRDDCSQKLGQSVDAATVTVPAYFQECQKNATREAAERAGLRLRPLLAEPVAAALAFVSGDTGDFHRLLVFDLGGGTFDVSLVQIAGSASQLDEKNIQVLEFAGDMWLGGDDFDQLIANRIYVWLQEKYQWDGRHDPQIRRKIKTLAENAKKALTDHDRHQILEPFLTRLPDKGQVSINLSLSRAEFECDIQPKVEHAMSLVEEVLHRLSLDTSKLNGVLLVGGSTLVPLVRRTLQTRFGLSKVRYDINPMLCVAHGAALWNQRFPLDQTGRVVLARSDKTGIPVPMNLGVEIYRDGNPHAFETIIPHGTVFQKRFKHPKQFRPTVENQGEIRVPVFQGTSEMTTYNACQGIIDFQLPQGIPGNTPVEIAFEIDHHGTLKVEIEVVGYPFRKETVLQRNQVFLTSEQQEKLKEWRDRLENQIPVAEGFVRQYQNFLTRDQLNKIQELIGKAREAIVAHDPENGTVLAKALHLALISSGTASVLLLAERAREIADGKTAEFIATSIETVKQAHTKGDPKLQQLSDLLKQAVHQVLAGGGTRGRGPGIGQLTLGAKI